MNTVGLIGCGSVARIFYVSILKTYFQDSRKLLYDINPVAAEQLATDAGGHSSDLESLIRQSDFIIITTPPETHFELLRQCVQRGKKVFCEKPFLLSGSETQRIVAQSQEHQVPVFVGHVRRFLPATELARRFLATQVLGNIQRIEVFEGGRFNYESQSGYLYKSPYGGVLPDTGSHSLDSMLYMAGWDEAPLNFCLEQCDAVPEPSHVFKASFRIRNKDNDIPVFLHLSRRERLANKTNFYCEKGILEAPLLLENSIRISTDSGTSVMHGEDFTHTLEEAFNRQFYHILYEEGELLRAERFVNLGSLLGMLLKREPPCPE